MNRRKEEKLARIIYGLCALSIASSLLAAYLGWRAVKALDDDDKANTIIYKLGYQKGVSNKYPFKPSEDDQ